MKGRSITDESKRFYEAVKRHWRIVEENTQLAKRIVEKAKMGTATEDELGMAQKHLKKIEEQSRLSQMLLTEAEKMKRS